jgi:class 3 adenylate cyclase/tetratricopeptide (TPR) repeat protein
MGVKQRGFEGGAKSDCRYCGFSIEPQATFCGGCGRPKTEFGGAPFHDLSFSQSNVPPDLVQRILRSGGATLGERKHVTVLFADMRGSTALIEQLDPEAALQILRPVLRSLMEAVHEHDGFVNQTLGDGIMALFGAPIASEDHALQACRAALAMQAGVDQLNKANGTNIAVRVGMNTGQVVIHSITNNLAINYEAVGKTVHLAARMEEIAEPGTIMLTDATYRLAKGFVDAEPRGLVKVKGLSEPIETFRLSAMRVRTRWQVRSARGLSVLVGRQAELRQIRDTLETAASGKGQSLTVVGEAGLGKSRLIHDFIRNLPDDWAVLETACSAQRTNSSYYPISNLIRSMFGVSTDVSHDEVKRRVGERIERLNPAFSEFLPAMFSLLDISSEDKDWKKLEPTERRNKIISAVRALIFHQEASTPVVILIEDVHWIDAETSFVLHNLMAAIGERRIVLLATQRPAEYWTDRNVPRLELAPLDDSASLQLTDWLMGIDGSLVQIKKRILAQAQGNPLFIEELVQTLKETRTLDGQPGNYRVVKAAVPIEIPQTIHSVLAARIDLLDGLPKSLLQTASVIGSDIPIDLLAGMIELAPAEILSGLQALEGADFLRKISNSTTADYAFKHELTRDVVYDTMLVSLRQSLHTKAVEIIESRFADRLGEHIDRLADHAFLAKLWDKAVPYQLRSCRRAVRRGANQDAIGIFERGLETVSHLPASDMKTKAEIDFRLAVVIALEPLGRHRQIVEVLHEASRLAESSGDLWRIAAVKCQLAVALWRLGQHSAAMAAAEAAHSVASNIDDPSLKFASLLIVGIVHHETGAFKKSIEIHERCLTLETPELDEKRAGWAAYPSVLLRTFMADCLIELGEFDRAEVLAKDASLRAVSADHAYSRANINHVFGRLRAAQGRHAEALPLLKESWQTCLDLNMVQMYPIFAARMGEVYLAIGDTRTAIDVLSVPEQLDVPLAEHAFGWRYLFIAQSRAFLADGRQLEARSAAERALELAEARGEPPQQAHALKLLGDIALKDVASAPEVSRRYFQRALEIAENCSMKPLAVQCRMALAVS